MGLFWACEQCRDSLIIGPDGLLGAVQGILVGWAYWANLLNI